MLRVCLLVLLDFVLSRRQYCTATCRLAARRRTPTFTLLPNDSLALAVALPVCQQRKFATSACLRTLGRASGADRTAARRGRPALILCMSTIPSRAALLGRTLGRLPLQTRGTDGVIVSVPRSFRRFPNSTVNVSAVLAAYDDGSYHDRPARPASHNPHGQAVDLAGRRPRFLLGVCDDNGPGTKVLCPLPTLLAEHATPHKRDLAWVVLIDDDVVYKEWALVAMRTPHPGGTPPPSMISPFVPLTSYFQTQELGTGRMRTPHPTGPCPRAHHPHSFSHAPWDHIRTTFAHHTGASPQPHTWDRLGAPWYAGRARAGHHGLARTGIRLLL